MIDYYTLYLETLASIYYRQIKTGADLFNFLLTTRVGKEISSRYPEREVKEIIFYNLDCLIEEGLVSAVELPISDTRIYDIEGLTNKGTYYINIINDNTASEVKRWHQEREISPTPYSTLRALRDLLF